MTCEQLVEVHQKRPFQPFDIHLAGRRVLPVDHPECLARTPTAGRTIGVGKPHGTIEIVDLLLVTSLSPRDNGATRRRRRRE